MPGTTPKYALPTLLGTDLARDIDTHVTALATAVDTMMAGYSEGLLAARPVSTSGSPGVAGREYYATDTGERFTDTGTGWYAIQMAGELRAHAGAAAPDGWLLCNGSSKLRSDFPALFAALGGASSPYGLPDGTHFNVPDLRGRVPVGEDAAGVRLATTTGRDRGESGGAEKHTLTTTEMPGHTHSDGSLTTSTTGAHSHPAPSGFLYYMGGNGLGISSIPPGGSPAQMLTVAAGTQLTSPSTTTSTGDHAHDVTGATGSAGSGDAHNNMPPYQVFNWLVKT